MFKAGDGYQPVMVGLGSEESLSGVNGGPGAAVRADPFIMVGLCCFPVGDSWQTESVTISCF
jgi:hypothetical protein